MADNKDGDLTRDRLRSLFSAKPSSVPRGPSSSSSSSSADKKDLPLRLAEELKGSKYKPRMPLSTANGNTSMMDRVFDDSMERAMYDEVLGPLVKPRALAPGTSPATGSKPILRPLSRENDSASRPPSETGTDFTTAVLRRLSTAEETERSLRRQLAVCIMENDRLQNENTDLKNRVTSSIDSGGDVDGLADQILFLKDVNRKYERQIAEMEQFLQDYGLEWIGNQPDEESDSAEDYESGNEEKGSDEEKIHAHLGFYEALRVKTEELNSLIKAEPVQVKTDDVLKRAKFVYACEAADTIKISYFRNGLLVKRGPFRPIGSQGYQSFMRDVLDGFFPSEFRTEYPNGMLFTLVDERKSDYASNDRVMSKTEFASRLPETIVKGGQVVSIKKEVMDKLASGNTASTSGSGKKESSSVVMIDTPAARIETSGQELSVKVATIQIRWIDGKQMLLAKMYADDLIFHLKEEIMKHFGGALVDDCPVFDLIAAYPPCRLRDDLTIAEAGLLPNGTVHAKKVS